MTTLARTWGFRCSLSDVAVLIIAGFLTCWFREDLGLWIWIIPLIVGHFFLFCNVFRISRERELWWAAICLANISGWMFCEEPRWLMILVIQIPVTIAVIIWDMQKSYYHGIFANHINPHLVDYIEERI